MVLADRALAPAGAAAPLSDSSTTLDLDHFASHVRADHLPHALLIDRSGSDAVADLSAQWLPAGIHVLTPPNPPRSRSLPRDQPTRAPTNKRPPSRSPTTPPADRPRPHTPP